MHADFAFRPHLAPRGGSSTPTSGRCPARHRHLRPLPGGMVFRPEGGLAGRKPRGASKVFASWSARGGYSGPTSTALEASPRSISPSALALREGYSYALWAAFTVSVIVVHKEGLLRDGDLIGISEIARIAGVSPQAVANWRRRAKDFPSPIAELASGPIFWLSHIRTWLRKKEVPMPDVISTINLKGGVGKTTTTVALAEFMAGRLGKRVLVIDLDPQTNATVMLIGEEQWRELNQREWTLARLFKDALDPDNKRFDLEKTLQKGVSNVSEASTIDLLPSSLDLIDVQDRLATVPPGRFYSVNPTELLWRAVKSRLDDYDLVIVDCPPNLGIITLNGLRISRGFVIPTIPDILSTYGIPQILARVRHFSAEIAESIEPLGVIVTKFQANSTVHKNTITRLRENGDPQVFETIVPQANQFAAAAEHGGRMTLKQKWGHAGLADQFEQLSREVADVLEVK